MTACVNRKHTKKVAAVVTASLVGALSLGVAPVAAMADDGISTQSVSEQQAWANGSVTYAHDNQGYIIEDPSNIEFEVGSGSKYPMVLEVTPKYGKAVRVSQRNVKYFTSTGRQITNPDRYNWGVGTYKVEISAPATSEYRGGVLEVEFRIVNHSLEGTQIFDATNGDIADTAFTYTGKAQQIGFLVDGNKVIPGTPGCPFTVDYYIAGSAAPLSGAPVNAGNYVAVLTGTGNYAGSEIQIPFTVGKLDLTNAVITISDVNTVTSDAWLPTSAKVNGVTITNADLSFKFISAENSDHVVKNKITYTVEVSPTTAGSKNMTGSQQATFSKVDILLTSNDVTFNGSPLDGQVVNVNLSKVSTLFDYDKIAFAFGSKLDIVTRDADGNVVDSSVVNDVAGDYTVTVRVDAKANQFKYGSDTVSMTVKTRNGDINADANAYFKYDGTVVDHVEPITYTGENILDDIDTVVEYEGGVLTEGEDYTVTVKNSLGQTVDSIVDAGVYHVIISSDLYNLTGDCELTVVAKPIVLTKVYIGSDAEKTFGTKKFIPYTGEAADYYFYTLDKDGKEVRLPEGTIELDHFYFVAEGETEAVDTDKIVEQGVYKASIKIAAGVKNYVFLGEESENTLKVDDTKVFSDVKSDDWGAEEIFKAYDLGYMRGYNGTSIFGKDHNIKRGDVCEVLYKMAGSPEWSNEGQTNGEYVTGFDDVREDMYYAKSISWAVSRSIVSVDSGTNNFRPEDVVSRQELAKMLAEYARATGADISADVSVLDSYKDADEVSPWAEEYVAWAVENDIMGVGTDELWATGNITRRQVAMMVVRYQPDGALADALVPSAPEDNDR